MLLLVSYARKKWKIFNVVLLVFGLPGVLFLGEEEYLYGILFCICFYFFQVGGLKSEADNLMLDQDSYTLVSKALSLSLSLSLFLIEK